MCRNIKQLRRAEQPATEEEIRDAALQFVRKVKTGTDGWTLSTVDGSLCAQFEHTLVIRRGHPIVITAL